MKKNFIATAVALLSVCVLSSCGKAVVKKVNENSGINRGIVHRVVKNDGHGCVSTYVRLQDGTVLKGGINEGSVGDDNSQIWDFYFVAPGDTVVYDDSNVIEVKFKD